MLLCLCGCQHDPYADWFVTNDIAESKLVGSYHVTSETLQHFASEDIPFLEGRRLQVASDARIVLENDYKIRVSEVPIDLGNRHACMLKSEGYWKVTKAEGRKAIAVTLNDVSGQWCPAGQFRFYLELFDDSLMPGHSATKYPLLHLTIGDPDSGDALQFERD